jgi:hypothetical protein
MIATIYKALEFIGGETDEAPAFMKTERRWLLRSVTWCLAIVLIYAFCGQSSKFIYIDF